MVNVNNYGVNTTGYNPVSTSQRTNQPVYDNQGNVVSRPNDSYALNTSTMPSGKVPTQVGMWDKMSVYFKDVMNTPQNLSAYKAFENAVKSNPDGYLQPGSSDAGKVKDLQKKFSYLGMNMTVNGQFGSATEQAVIRFKKSVGINDGYMDKNGNMAVTPIVTPQVWSILNAQVASKINPNGNVSAGGNTSYVSPVTTQELNWAKELTAKIKQYGYKPTAQERAKYENIYQRQQAGAITQNTSAPSQQEVNWAKQMAVKIQQYGYKPNPEEVQQYKDIYNRLQTSKTQPQVQSQPQTQPNSGVSQQDIAWATSMMNKIKGGYNPTPQEAAKYQEIFNKTQSGNVSVQTTQPQTQPVTQEELAWAQQLEARVTQGYNPTAQERAKYEDIFNRNQNQGAVTNNTQTQGNQQGQGVTQQELTWAQDLENRVNTQGYKPTQQEIDKYTDIFNRNKAVGSQPTAPVQKPTQREIDWALELERKTKEEGYKPTQNELAIYNDIATKLNAAQAEEQKNKGVGNASGTELAWASQMYAKMQGGYTPTPQEMGMLNRIQQKASGAGNTDNTQPQIQSTPDVGDTPAPTVTNKPTKSDFTAVSEFAYNDATITAFKNAFPGVKFKGGNVPYLPDTIAKQVAKKYGFGSVSELQSAVGANVDGRFGPETFFRLTNQGNNVGGTNTENTTAPKNGVTQQELDWAVNLQSKFSSGYKPTAEEQAKYTDIFNRYNAGGVVSADASDNVDATSDAGITQPSGTGAPTQEELDWATALQAKLTSGYTPTEDEKAKYTDIYNRYNASGNQVAGTSDPSATVSVNTGNSDQELQWALALLDKVQQQNYQPTEDELARYEQIIAKNQTVKANP